MATRDPFDYFFGEILRLAPGQRRPDHYSLLGLAFFEKSEERIRRAGHTKKRDLRAAPAGPPEFEHVRRQLIERVREARRVLLDPERREAYDAALIGRREAAEERAEFHLDEGGEFGGRYRILRELRRGAFDRVYAALDQRAGRRVELTVLPPDASRDPDVRRGAARAAKSLARADVPGLVRASGAGEAEGLVYARWPQPEGLSLSMLVRRDARGRLDVEDAARIGNRLAGIVAAMHGAGFVHGDLNARNVFVTDDGQVSVAECGLAAAVARSAPQSPYSAPEREVSPAADRYALGALVFFLLQGEAPFLAGRRALVPKALPDDVPLPLAKEVLGLLARDPAQRPEAPQFAAEAPPSPRRRRLAWAGAALLLLAVILGALLGGGDRDRPRSPVAEAWKLIEDRRFADAIDLLEAQPADDALAAPLASALEGEAHRAEAAGDPYAAFALLARAQEASADPGRAKQAERVRALLRARLDAVAVGAPAIARQAIVRVDAKDAALSMVLVDGASARAGDPIAIDRPEGEQRVAFELVDRAGLRRAGELLVVVDATPPEVVVEAPADGTMRRDGNLEFVVRVDDAHPPAAVTIAGRETPLAGGTARRRIQLPNGEHRVEVVAVDRAGNEGRAAVAVTIDDRAPEIELERARIVTGGPEATLRGHVRGVQPSLQVDGVAVPLGEDGAFERRVPVEGRRTVELVARGTTGVVNRATVECVRDVEAPSVAAAWPRVDGAGRLLYGGPVMDAGVLRVPLKLADATALTFEPSEGEVRDESWVLVPKEGERDVRLRVLDEAGNVSELALRLSGRRATPRLAVRTTLGALTRDDEATLEVEADGDVRLNDRPVEPGRIDVPLPEGELSFVVRAYDEHGNFSEWRHDVVVDRTPPTVRIVGSTERGVGRQTLVLESDEDLASIACFAEIKETGGKRFRFHVDLEPGRTQVHVEARDHAGNLARLKLPLRVVNRVLLLDGTCAVRVPLDRIEGDFSLEFWARAVPAIDPGVLVRRAGGWAVYWASADEALPHALLPMRSEGEMALVTKKLRDTTDWHHYALVRDGRKWRFFLDGLQQQYLESKLDVTAGGREILIGAGAVDDKGQVVDGYIGRLDELRLSHGARYTRAFRPKRHFDADDDTFVLLRFDRLFEKDHPDESGHEHHGKSVGKPRLVIHQE